MLKNVKMKRVLKGTIFKVVSIINLIIPKNDNIVLLYSSNRGIHNNLFALKQYILTKHYDDKYKICCGIENIKYADKDKKRVVYYTKLKSIFVFLRARHVFYSTGQIPIKPSNKQIVIHLDHGAATYKKCGALSKINNGDEFFFTYYLAPSELYIPIVEKTFLCSKKNIVVCGEAVTDTFYRKNVKYDLGSFSKIILWAPTFRQSDYYGYDDSSEELIPMFNREEYCDLNIELKKHNFKLIVKLHPGQDLNGYDNLKLSNLTILSDEDFIKQKYDLYKLLLQIDCMIADYSSIYLQFLLLDRPIAFVIPDFDEYEERRGCVFDNPKYYMPGEHIVTKQQLYEVFDKWDKGIDEHKTWRNEIRNLIHKYQDGNNAKRAIELSDMHI